MKKISDKTADLMSQLADSMIQDLDLDKELIRDYFPLKKPYRGQASEALLTLETRMKKRLKLKRDLTKAIKGIPNGRDQVDHGTLFTWMNKLTNKDKKAIRQLIAIDATACKRSA